MQCLQAKIAVSDLSVLERRRLHFDWQQQGQEQPSHHSFDADLCVQSLDAFTCFGDGLPDLAQYSLPVASNFEEAGVAVSNGNSKKRKAESSPKSKNDLVIYQLDSSKEESNCKRVKQETGGGGESRQQNNRKEASGDTSNKNEEHPKGDYIHVRARRGQATDSHSLAERVRRERISQRMKYLQELVPGCSKITGKAGMLDEIINYVQSLQRQVEFLSMKLAAVNPLADVNFLSGEAMAQLVQINPGSKSSCSMGISSEPMDQPFLHFNSLQAHPCSGLDMYMDSSSDLVPDGDGSSFGSCSTLNSLYGVEFQLGRGTTTAFPFQSFQGNLLPNNLKMEI